MRAAVCLNRHEATKKIETAADQKQFEEERTTIMKTSFNSIALTLAGVAIFGLALANGNVKTFAARNDQNPIIENVQIADNTLSENRDENGKCCYLNVLDESPDDQTNLNGDQARSVDDDNLRQNDVANPGSRDENRDDSENVFRHNDQQN